LFARKEDSLSRNDLECAVLIRSLREFGLTPNARYVFSPTKSSTTNSSIRSASNIPIVFLHCRRDGPTCSPQSHLKCLPAFWRLRRSIKNGRVQSNPRRVFRGPVHGRNRKTDFTGAFQHFSGHGSCIHGI